MSILSFVKDLSLSDSDSSESDGDHWTDICRAVKVGHEKRAISMPNTRYNHVSLLINSLDGLSASQEELIDLMGDATTSESDSLADLLKFAQNH